MNACLINLRPPEQRYVNIVVEITSLAGMKYIPIYASGTPNACATTFYNSEPVITYNPDFIYPIEHDSYWAMEAVIAHEIAHHYYDHLDPINRIVQTSHYRELQADYFAGLAMGHRGAPLHEALRLYNHLPKWASRTHPARSIRITRFREGFFDAEYQILSHRTWNRSHTNVVEGLAKAAVVTGVVFGVAGLLSQLFRS